MRYTRLPFLFLLACGTPKQAVVEPPPEQDDTAQPEDARVAIDDEPAPVVPEVTRKSCEEVLAAAWPLNDAVSSGTIVLSHPSEGVNEAVLDASAGGTSAIAKTQPFLYLDLDTGAAVAISDPLSLRDNTWELAFKRPYVRTNSEDSGTAGVTLARLSPAAYADVLSLPEAVTWATDDTLQNSPDDGAAACRVKRDVINAPWTAMNQLAPESAPSQSWYDYGDTPGGLSVPKETVYLVRNGAGTLWKLEIVAYDAGKWTLRWQTL